MQVKDVAGVGLASRRTAQRERHLTVSDGLLGQVVIDHEHVAAGVLGRCRLAVLAVVHEVLADGGARHGRDVLQRCGIGRRSGNDDRVVERRDGAKGLPDVGDRGSLLADGHVDADNALAPLVDDGIDGDGGLAGLAVADDELALAAADRDHRVDGEDTGLQRLATGVRVDDAGALNSMGRRCVVRMAP